MRTGFIFNGSLLIFLILLLHLTSLTVLADPVPTTINDFFMSGSQPLQSGTFRSPSQCDNCHGGYDYNAEPAFNWRGSMMSQAMRDPLYLASLAIANQDAPQSGDLCIRCHSPSGWLEGRSTPTDGSALTAADRESVHCHFCHKMVKPTSLGINPYPNDPDYTSNTYPRDQIYLATISSIPAVSGDGMYIVDSDDARRGPFSDANANHQIYYSPFHSDLNFCGTCHDVSNPAFSIDSTGRYVPNSFGQAAPNLNPYSLFPIERTFSEWSMSDYNTSQGIYAPQFGGNKTMVSTCQDCHLRDVTGKGCNRSNVLTRNNMPKHDMTGGNTFIPNLIDLVYPGEANLVALDSGIVRATYMLQNAASMELSVLPQGTEWQLTVRVTNETGHKLPSGYPEGRRIWLNVKAYDLNNNVIYESGAYDSATGILNHDADLKVYEIKPGISPTLAPVVNLLAGPSFHFVQNDTVYKDNRIPPHGFTNANFDAIGSPVVAYSYTDGQYWDDTDYFIPANSASVEVTLYYQTTSKEFVEFLRDVNTTNNMGTTMYNLWATHGKSEPVAMTSESLLIPTGTVPRPVNDLVVVTSGNDISLSWSPVQQDTSGLPIVVDYYRIYRSTNPMFTPSSMYLIGSATTTTYTDSGILNSSEAAYFYKVTAVIE